MESTRPRLLNESTAMGLLQVRDLHTIFRGEGAHVAAVDGVSFEIAAGESLGLVGESGCGKSVTALSLMRLIRSPGAVDAGEVWFEGQNLLTLDESAMRRLRGRRMAMIFQDPVTSLDPMMTIGGQLSEAVAAHSDRRGSTLRGRVVELLALVGIPDPTRRYHDYPHQFSGGMCQRLGIAMALACSPALILADEITTALDVTIQAQILDLLKQVTRDAGMAVLLITHDLGIAAGSTDRVHVMYAGQIVEKAATTELFENPQMPYTWGLLQSLPRLDDVEAGRLRPIEGQPYDPLDPSPGCRFETRCPYSRPICAERVPNLIIAADGSADHEVRCFGTQDVEGGGWLRGIDWRGFVRDAAGSRQPDTVGAAKTSTEGVESDG